MTIRAITEGGRPAPEASGVALVFVLNTRYLDAFRVLIYSLHKHGSLLDLPVVLLSDEAEVLEDPLVRTIADRTRLVDETEKKLFAQTRREKVQDKYRLEWIAKYTFLKWLIFDDYGYERLFYIDADMIALRPLEPMLDVDPTADMVACPKFPNEVLDGDRAQRSIAVAAFAASVSDPQTVSMNSGIMVIGPRLMTGAFREGLIDLATQRAFPSEQRAVWVKLLKDDYRLAYAPVDFNFKTIALDRIDAAGQHAMLDRAAVLHFIGQSKPWESDRVSGPSSEAWMRYADEAAAFSPALLAPTGHRRA